MFGIFPARKLNCLKKIASFLFLLVFCKVLLQALEVENSTALSVSQKLYSSLKENDFKPIKQPLIAFDNTYFPYNITITVPAAEVSNIEEENLQELPQTARSTLIIVFEQKFALSSIENVSSLINSVKSRNFPYETIFFFGTNDTSLLPESVQKCGEGGTDFFVSTISNPDSCFAIVVEESKNNTYEIISGKKDIAPSWLFHSLRDACIEISGKKPFASTSFGFYKNDYFRENKKVSSFLEEHIPAVSITSNGSEESFEILFLTALKLVNTRSDHWERHYNFISLGNRTIKLSESFFAIIYILFAFFCFFILLFFIFRGKEKFKILLASIFRQIYLIPELIVITTSILYLIRFILQPFSIDYEKLFAVKFLCSVFIPVFLMCLQFNFFKDISSSVLGVILLVTGIFNVFLFANFDISLLFLVFIEYSIILFSCFINRTRVLVPLLLFMLVPFLPYITDFLSFASFDGIKKIVNPSFGNSIFFSSVIFSFQIQILRILICLNNRFKDILKTKVQRRNSIIIIFIVFIFFCILFINILHTSVLKSNLIQEEQKKPLIVKNTENHFDVKLSESPFMELTTRTLTITSSSNVLRYIVYVKQDNGVPLYDCNISFQLDNPHQALILLPDNPGKKVNIIYTSDPYYDSTVSIDAYILSAEDTVLKENYEISIKSNIIQEY